MVSAISITQGISICLLASSMVFSSSALPVAGQQDDSSATLPKEFAFPTSIPTGWFSQFPTSFPKGSFPTGSFPIGSFPTGSFPTGSFPTSFPASGSSSKKENSDDSDTSNDKSVASAKPTSEPKHSSSSSSSSEKHNSTSTDTHTHKNTTSTDPDAHKNTTHIESRSDNNNNNDATEMATSSQVNELTMYAGVASTAYCRTVVPLKQWSCVQCKKWVSDGEILTTFTSAVSDTNGFVLRSKSQKTIYLVFRGTNSYQSAMTDMIGTPVAYGSVSGAYVHAGFYSSVKEVINSYYPKIQSEIKANPDYKVVVTGHSLGGAQALLAGVDLLQRDSSKFTSKNVKIYTIGQPRVGNKKFAQYVDSTGIDIHRSVHKADMVPQVPPRYSGFFHVGVESWIKRDPSTTQICTSNLESDKCSYTTSAMTNAIDHLTYFGISEGSCL